MKANELRVNNWVYCIEDHVNIEILPSDVQLAGQFEPITLTEEWLIKFGFKYMDAFGWIKDFITMDGTVAHYSFDLWRGTYSVENCDLTEIPQEIKYVHQLQNLYFALVGEELTIEEQ